MREMKHACRCLLMAAGMFVFGVAAFAGELPPDEEQPPVSALRKQEVRGETPPARQDDMGVIQPDMGEGQATNNQEDDGWGGDPSLTTHQAAVECAMAKIVEDRGRRHLGVGHPLQAAFQTGVCTGKIQTYIMMAQAQRPDCFPKMTLNEGIEIFVNWAEAHRELGNTNFLGGLDAAFADHVPCLKKKQ